MAALTAVDRAASVQLARVATTLARAGALAAEAGWISAEVPPSASPVLTGAGIIESPAALAVLAAADPLPDTPAGNNDLRRALAALPPSVLAGLLLAHPDLTRRLGGQNALPPPKDHRTGGPVVDSPEAGLAAVLALSAASNPEARISAVRNYFRTLTPQQARTLALLYPDVIGNLDGAPVTERAAANRIRISVARDDLLSRHARQAEAARTGRGQRPGDGLIWHDDTADKTVAESTRARIAYYSTLLNEPEPDPDATPGTNPGPGGSSGDDTAHRILYFDPSGDGGIADVWGPLGPDTTHVGILVPGTTTDLGSFANYSAKARRFTQDAPSHETAVITWLGSDAPDAIAQDAPSPTTPNAPAPGYATSSPASSCPPPPQPR